MSTEYIERGALDEELKKAVTGYIEFGHIFDVVRERAKRVPAADVEPVVHEPCEFCAGTLYNDYALENVNGKYPKIVSCASANRQLGRGQKRFKCCPNCGRKLDMDERSEHED